MSQGKYIGWMVLMVAFILTGCRENEPAQRVGLPISICLPASEMQAARAPRKSIGDPGETEAFRFPHHLYFIVIKNNGDDTWSVWHQESRTLTNDDWKATRYVGLLPTMNDSIYQYKEEIDLLLSAGDKFVGRVYAIASAEELTFNKAINTLSGLDDVLNLSFSTAGKTMQDNLQHIYTSPYNLEQYGAYYGEFNSTYQKVPHINLLLYHVAAKVDITWAVNDGKRPDRADTGTKATAVRLTYMKAQHLFEDYAYCFRPMENVKTTKLGTGYERVLIKPTDEGLWWEGRAYFYTIPYTTDSKPDYFPLQMELETNSSGDLNKNTLNLKINTSSPFVPWLRANFNISAPLPATDGSAEKDID